MSVHYKFKSALEYDTVTFDGLHISVKDLKNAIVQQKRIGKNTDFDLQVTNAQTKDIYKDDNVLIPKNTSLLIARIPTTSTTKNKQWEGYGGDATPPTKLDEGGPISKAVDLSSLDAPEGDKIKAMISQSTQDYDPSNYMKIRGANQMGAVPPNYRCYKCHQTGHWIKDCPLSKGPEPIEIKKSTGIPLSFMVPVEGPQVQGAMMTPNGSYAVPVLDHQTYTQKPNAAPAPIQEMKPEIPEDLLCSICSDLLTDAVMIPCCGNSFCDECVRGILLESEEHECPDCHEKDISPVTLIPNRFLRNSVSNFKNTTGYVKISRPMEGVKIKVKEAIQEEEKTVISEADSTEPKTEEKEEGKEEVAKVEPEVLAEGPPGVSPEESPKIQAVPAKTSARVAPKMVVKPQQIREEAATGQSQRGSPFREERPGTPTVDEPGMPAYPPTEMRAYSAPTNAIPAMMGVVPQMQAPPPSIQGYHGGFPLANGPPPNFRLPPPGAPPYMGPAGYPVAPRPMYDSSRPPMNGPPPMYNPNYVAPGSRREYPMGGGAPGDRRMRGRTPSGVIDDPLAAFNRMLREKDERERRAKRQLQRRSYSRSRSRSRSYSRSPPPRRMRSRSPRRRQSRSRSRSFSISRSRSRSFSGSPFRDFSPRHSPPRRRGPSRYRSPVRSPPRRRFKESHASDHFRERERERHHHERDHRDYERGYSRERGEHRRDDRERDRDRDRERDRDRDRERDYNFYDNYDERIRKNSSGGGPMPGGPNSWPGSSARGNVGGNPLPPQNDNYHYHNHHHQQQQQSDLQQHSYPPSNRYPPREYIQQYGAKQDLPPVLSNPSSAPNPMHLPPAHRRFDDVAPPGVEEPPIPGMETAPPPSIRYDDPPAPQPQPPQRFERFSSPPREPKPRDLEPTKKSEEIRRRKREKSSRSPEKSKYKSKSRDRESPDKIHKRKKREASSERDKKLMSDDEKSKKNKDRKKKKDKKDSDKKKRKDKKEKHKKDDKDKDKDKERKHKDDVKEETKEKKTTEEKTAEEVVVPQVVEEKRESFEEELLHSEIKTGLEENYEIPIAEKEEEKEQLPPVLDEKPAVSPPQQVDQEQFDDSVENILEIHPTDTDLKTELDPKSEFLAQLPEKSKWEFEEDSQAQNSPKSSSDQAQKCDKSGKVTNEVLKRAENAIFAKAINAIRPIEIKKISTDRAKLYSDEKEEIEEEKAEEVVEKKVEVVVAAAAPARLSVKERLGVKISEENERVVKVERDRNKSRSLSPFSRRNHEVSRNYGLGERRVELVERRRREERSRRDQRQQSSRRDYRRDDPPGVIRRDSKRSDDRQHHSRRDEKKRERSKSKPKHETRERERDTKRKRSKSTDKRKKDKKPKKEKKEPVSSKKAEPEETKTTSQSQESNEKKVNLETKKKPTIDEANFEPDYDLESESDKDEKKVVSSNVKDKDKDKDKDKEEKKSSSSSESSESSSDDDKKKKKHRKHRKSKKTKRTESSSSSSESESESSDDENKDRKRKKHKKKQKKRKKSKHK